MAVAAHDRRAGQRETGFRPDDVDDALVDVGRADVAHAEFGRVALQRGKLLRALGVGDRNSLACGIEPRGGRQIVVWHREGQVGAADRAPGHAQRLEGLRAGHLVNQVAVDIQDAGAVFTALHFVGVPDLFVEGAGSAGHGGGAKPADPA